MSTLEIIAKLTSTFVQTHTSFIINMEHIREIGKNYVRLSNCENIIELPISRKFKTDALNKDTYAKERFILMEDELLRNISLIMYVFLLDYFFSGVAVKKVRLS